MGIHLAIYEVKFPNILRVLFWKTLTIFFLPQKIITLSHFQEKNMESSVKTNAMTFLGAQRTLEASNSLILGRSRRRQRKYRALVVQ